MLKNLFILLIVLLCAVFAASSGCSEKSNEKTNVKIESTDNSGGKTETKITSTENSNDWCRVGSSVSQYNPQTGMMENVRVTGIETVDGIPMCKAVYESDVNDTNYTRLEYLWSQDGKISFMTAFDSSGKKIYEASMKNGTMRIVDKDGKVTEFMQGQKKV